MICSDEMSLEIGVNYNCIVRYDCMRCFRFVMYLGVVEFGFELSFESDLIVFLLILNFLLSMMLLMLELLNKLFED